MSSDYGKAYYQSGNLRRQTTRRPYSRTLNADRPLGSKLGLIGCRGYYKADILPGGYVVALASCGCRGSRGRKMKIVGRPLTLTTIEDTTVFCGQRPWFRTPSRTLCHILLPALP